MDFTGSLILIYNFLYSTVFFLYAVLCTLPRDLLGITILTRVNWMMWRWKRRKVFVGDLLKENALKHPLKACIIYGNDRWTFEMVHRFSNQVANYFCNFESLKPGDTVAILMENRPEYPCFYVGFTKIGVISALINTNIRYESLIHSIRISGARYLIYTDEFSDAISSIKDKLNNVQLLYFGSASRKHLGRHLDIDGASFDDPPYYPIKRSDLIFMIYTSGTTGLPKAARIKHNRFLIAVGGCFRAHRLSANDILYNPLPLYHSLGGWLCTGYSLCFGCTMVIRKKFSASLFWKECALNDCTVFAYIGEMCRYLLNTEFSPFESLHSVRFGFGNGMRKPLWEKFINRFHIERLAEFYAATEGNAYFFNLDNTVGSCGFNSILFPYLLPSRLVKFDESTYLPIRGSDGFCIAQETGKRGLLISPITKTLRQHFDGYHNATESSKKILRDVFEKGDKAYNSGDVLIQDAYGNYFFCDRIGDTFRWKGENVSSYEVESMIISIINRPDVIVYGVEVGEHDGKAGMAAICCPDLDLTDFSQEISKKLASYAIPVFIRLCNDIDRTGTFKLSKVRLRNEGLSGVVGSSTDNFFYFSIKHKLYKVLTPAVLEEIRLGTIRI